MGRVTFRFYEELNDFLPKAQRKHDFEHECAPGDTAKQAIESLGIPHTEVEVILVNGESVGFDHPLKQGDRVAVYPVFESLDVTPLVRLRERPLRVTRFIADVHLGRLATLLRMAGFDTLFDKTLDDAEIAQIAAREGRIILTRDRKLLERGNVTHGCYLHPSDLEHQLRELFARLDLSRSARPFTRCLVCNSLVRPAGRVDVAGRVPPKILELHERFTCCETCGRVYWEGTHWRRMRALLDELQVPRGTSGDALGATDDRE